MMFSPIANNPLHQKMQNPLFFSDDDDQGDKGSVCPQIKTEQTICSRTILRKSSLRSASDSPKLPCKTTRWASPLSVTRLIPPRTTIISEPSPSSSGMEHMMSQLFHLELDPHNPEAQDNTISEPPTALPPPRVSRSPDRPAFSGDLVILQKPRPHPVHPKWDIIVRNNLRHLPAAQQTSRFDHDSIWTEETEIVLLSSPLFPEISMDTPEEGRGNMSLPAEMNAPVGGPVNVVRCDPPNATAAASTSAGKRPVRPKVLPSERKVRKEGSPQFNHGVMINQENHDASPDTGAGCAVKRRRLQNNTGNHISTAEGTLQLTFGGDDTPPVDSSPRLATFRQHHEGVDVAVSPSTGRVHADKGKDRDHGGDGGRDQKECLAGPRRASIDGKWGETGHSHNDLPLAVIFSQAKSWQANLKTFKKMEEKGKISVKMSIYLERQLTRIDQQKEGVTREVLQQSKLAKAIRLFAHRTAYGPAVREKAIGLLDFFGRRYLGRPLRERNEMEADRS